MEVLLNVVLENVGAQQPQDHLVKMLSNNRPILYAASKRIVDGSTELLQAVGSMNADQAAVLVFCLSVHAEKLETSNQREYLDRALSPLERIGRYSVADMQQIRNGESYRIIVEAILTVSRKVVDVAHSLGVAGTVVLPLERLVSVLCPADNTMTTLHSALMEAYVSAGMHGRGYKQCKSNPIFQIDGGMCASLAFDALTYFYYASMCCLALKQYDAALVYLMDAITLPSPRGISVVVAAALKKARIVSMLTSTPTPLDLPKYSSHSVVRLSKQGDAAYDTLRQLFEADDYKGLNAHISNDNIKRELQADGNFGLAKLVVDALLRKRVQSLVPVFSRMRLTDILRMKFSDTDWTVADLEYFIVRLSTFGEISVRIDQSDGTVSFLSSDFVDANQPAVSGGHDVVSLLQERMATSMKLSERVRMLEYEMNKNPTLLARKVVALKQGNGGPDDIAQNPMLADDLIDMVLDNDDSEAM